MTTTATAEAPATLSRTFDFTPVPTDDGLTLEGYAAVFDAPTRISGWEGNFTETVRKGAFARAVRQNPRPVLQFDHGQHPLLGSIPIGAVSSLKEDQRGLYVQARIHDNWMTEPVRDAIRSEAIRGMSFRFRVPEGGDEWNDDGTQRSLIDVDLLELGPVVFPAYPETEVSLRSQELADALAGDDEIRHDFAIALMLARSKAKSDSQTATTDDGVAVPTTQPDPTDHPDEGPSVTGSTRINPARGRADIYVARARLAAARSRHSHGSERLSEL